MTKSPVLLTLQLSAALTALLALVQTVLGSMILSGSWVGAHKMIGFVTLAVSVVAAVAAFLWMRRGGNKGLFMHAAGMVVLFVAQVGLGEAGARTVHVVLGFAVLLGAVALATLAYGKPGVVEEPVAADRLR